MKTPTTTFRLPELIREIMKNRAKEKHKGNKTKYLIELVLKDYNNSI